MSLPAAIALILSAALPQVHTASGAQDAAESEVVSTGSDRHDRMTVPVRVGDNGPFHFLIDTGAQNTVLSSALAAQLALKPTGRAQVVGVAGRELVDTVEVDEIALGRRSYYGLLAPLLSAGNIGADGIVGLDSLQGQRVLIDFRKNLMVIDEAKNLGGNRGFEIIVTARRRSGQLIMTNAKIDGVWTDVVIDTGAEGTIGNRALQRALARRGRSGEQTVLTSVTGQQIMADMGAGSTLTFSDAQINNVVIAFADAPPFALLELEKRPAILLGMRELRVFRRVAIDFETRRILFDLPTPPSGAPADIGGVRDGRRIF
ncbi:MAG: aspartyl protease family protein [Sphingomonadales bacterium]|nr:aspartyl protease family protein [Sphingomonadales bacterium]